MVRGVCRGRTERRTGKQHQTCRGGLVVRMLSSSGHETPRVPSARAAKGTSGCFGARMDAGTPATRRAGSRPAIPYAAMPGAHPGPGESPSARKPPGRQGKEGSRGSLVPTWVISLLTLPCSTQPRLSPCHAAAARAFSSLGALHLDKSKHLLNAKADGRWTHLVPEEKSASSEPGPCSPPGFSPGGVVRQPRPRSPTLPTLSHPLQDFNQSPSSTKSLTPTPSAKQCCACVSSTPGHLFLHPARQRPQIRWEQRTSYPTAGQELQEHSTSHIPAIPPPSPQPSGRKAA